MAGHERGVFVAQEGQDGAALGQVEVAQGDGWEVAQREVLEVLLGAGLAFHEVCGDELVWDVADFYQGEDGSGGAADDEVVEL